MTKVTIVSTPDDGSCGIGTYTGILQRAMDGVSLRHIPVRLRSLDPVHYARKAVQASLDDSDVVHVQHEYGIFGPKSLTSWVFFSILFLLTGLTRTPVVLTLHSAWNDETIGPPAVRLKSLYVKLNNWLLALSTDHFVFLSENCRDRFLESVQADSYEVIPHGVQTETVEMDQRKAKQKFGYEPDDTVIVEPGYIRSEKGQDIFIDIARELPEYEFLIAGGTQAEEDELFLKEVESEAPDNVQITGVLNDERFHAAFNAAELVVLPYREVTQSGIFNWCVAYELPVLGSDSGYFNKLQEEWDAVRVFDPTEIDGAVTTIVKTLQNPIVREELRDAISSYEEASSMEDVAHRHVRIYEECPCVGDRSSSTSRTGETSG